MAGNSVYAGLFRWLSAICYKSCGSRSGKRHFCPLSALSSPPFSRGRMQVLPRLRLPFPGDGCRFDLVFASLFQGMGAGSALSSSPFPIKGIRHFVTDPPEIRGVLRGFFAQNPSCTARGSAYAHWNRRTQRYMSTHFERAWTVTTFLCQRAVGRPVKMLKIQ